MEFMALEDQTGMYDAAVFPKPFRHPHISPCQMNGTPLQERSWAVLRAQFGSVRFRGIWASLAAKRTRREHIGLVSRCFR